LVLSRLLSVSNLLLFLAASSLLVSLLESASVVEFRVFQAWELFQVKNHLFLASLLSRTLLACPSLLRNDPIH
jgi:hypothetical protein